MGPWRAGGWSGGSMSDARRADRLRVTCACGPLAQWQSCGLLIHRFRVRVPGGPLRSSSAALCRAAVFVITPRTAAKYSSSASPVQCAAKPLEGVAGGRRGHHRVDLHGDGELRVPEDLHRHPRVHVQVRKERGAGPPGIPDGDPPDSGRVTAPVPEAVEVARLDWPPVAGGEDLI